MSCLGNLIWFVFAGFWQGMAWTLAGVLWTITVIGIPIGQQCFKFASLSFSPFGRDVVFGGGAVSFLLNLIWLLVSGLPIALTAATNGLVLCCTVVISMEMEILLLKDLKKMRQRLNLQTESSQRFAISLLIKAY